MRIVKKRLLGLLAAAALLALPVAYPSGVLADTTKVCHTDYHSIFQGFIKSTAATNALTEVQALIDLQAMPLCTENSPFTASASMAWVMIAQLNGTDNYIQMGTRNCAIGCGFNCCATNGATELFMERNNGNILGKREVDLGYPSTGQHKFNITYYTPSNGGQSKFIMSMDDVTKYIEMDDGWRDWSLSAASFELITETWNQSDQNGGAPGNSLFMQKAKRGLNQNPLVSVSFTGACMDGDDSGPAYGCQSLTDLVTHDGVATWTNDR